MFFYVDFQWPLTRIVLKLHSLDLVKMITYWIPGLNFTYLGCHGQKYYTLHVRTF